MTEKRFQYNVNKNTIEENGEFVAYVNSVDGFRIANKLTTLAKENEQLKQSYKEFEDECQSTFNAMSRKQNDLYRKNFKLKEENEQLKSSDTITDLETEIMKLKQENEQLKQRNDRQAKQLDNLYNLIEKQDWKTLKGLIQEFQECEEQLQKEWSEIE